MWLPIAAAVTFAGGVIIAAGGDERTIAFLGAFVIFLGFNLWVPATYARSAENFPTRARTTGFASSTASATSAAASACWSSPRSCRR